MRFFPGCCCGGETVAVTCGSAIVNVPATLYVTVIDEDGDCPDLADISFELVHYPPYDGSGIYGSSTKHWYPTTFNGADPSPQFPCDTAPILTQYIAIGCLTPASRTYGITLHGVISTGPSNQYGVSLTEAELSASPLLFEWVNLVANDVFECCDVYPANLRVIISETPP